MVKDSSLESDPLVRLVYYVQIAKYGFTYRHDCGIIFIFIYDNGDQIGRLEINVNRMDRENKNQLKEFLGIK